MGQKKGPPRSSSDKTRFRHLLRIGSHNTTTRYFLCLPSSEEREVTASSMCMMDDWHDVVMDKNTMRMYRTGRSFKRRRKDLRLDFLGIFHRSFAPSDLQTRLVLLFCCCSLSKSQALWQSTLTRIHTNGLSMAI
jgi:hypothetical protein